MRIGMICHQADQKAAALETKRVAGERINLSIQSIIIQKNGKHRSRSVTTAIQHEYAHLTVEFHNMNNPILAQNRKIIGSHMTTLVRTYLHKSMKFSWS